MGKGVAALVVAGNSYDELHLLMNRGVLHREQLEK